LPEIFKEKSIQEKTYKQFSEGFGGKDFYIYSIKVGDKKEIFNKEVIEEIREEIKRLQEG
jgi:predicted RND superfamily exporter protein